MTPLDRNLWNLNIELRCLSRGNIRRCSAFSSPTTGGKDGQPTEEETLMVLNQGDDSAIPVPNIFIFAPGMSVVVNQSTHQGLKLVNGASYTALDVILDKAYASHRIATNASVTSASRLGFFWRLRRLETSTSSACLPVLSS